MPHVLNRRPARLDAMPRSWEPLPPIDLRQLLRLTDDTGIFQHAVFAAPDPNHGYCIDDNARALIAAALHAQLRGHNDQVVPLTRYLSFLHYAYNDSAAAFRNFMGYDRRWLEEVGSTDSQGRAIWALGLTVRLAPDDVVHDLARNLLKRALPSTEKLTALRSRAFALIGLNEYVCAAPDDDHARRIRDHHAVALYDAFCRHASDDWPWWEDTVTYDNAKLPHALLMSGSALGRADMIDAALRALRWLLQVQTAPQGHLSIIGNDGWLRRGHDKAAFDQQPLEAHAMVHGCLAAAGVTGDDTWAQHAWTCFRWFHGFNDLDQPLYHDDTGGCQDGLSPAGPNRNQGAESTLAYLLCTLELHRYRIARSLRP